jgi:hypothetical protein
MGAASTPSQNTHPEIELDPNRPKLVAGALASYTTVHYNHAVHSMRAMALSLLDKMEWRHHGIGCLQGYVFESGEPEVRMHLWCPRLLKPGMHISGDAHDHRFDMLSHVLVGTVEHEEMIPEADPEGDYAMLALTHARAAADSNYHGPTTPLPGFYRVARNWWTIHEGYSYRFPMGQFHRSPLTGDLDDIAVTIIEKHVQTDIQARLLYPVKHEPVMAFGHETDEDLVGIVTSLAEEALLHSLRR